jgi:hypothetical protein
VTLWIVTSQHRREWPAKDYQFRDEKQANMFAAMCRRDGAYRTEKRRAA